ncbi:uncharacterized protein [Parasteatoda tepidariorum]|uniref:uncharacterized protein n=1 Tax=Parasteatoda tepidariorum TaxID=114398 RepID=UPI0039BD5B62
MEMINVLTILILLVAFILYRRYRREINYEIQESLIEVDREAHGNRKDHPSWSQRSALTLPSGSVSFPALEMENLELPQPLMQKHSEDALWGNINSQGTSSDQPLDLSINHETLSQIPRSTVTNCVVGEGNVFPPFKNSAVGEGNIFSPFINPAVGEGNILNQMTYSVGERNVFSPSVNPAVGEGNVLNQVAYSVGERNVFSPFATPVVVEENVLPQFTYSVVGERNVQPPVMNSVAEEGRDLGQMDLTCASSSESQTEPNPGNFEGGDCKSPSSPSNSEEVPAQVVHHLRSRNKKSIHCPAIDISEQVAFFEAKTAKQSRRKKK